MSIVPTAISISFLHHHNRIRKPCIFSRATAPPTSSRLLCSATTSNSGESEESRWLREEHRWLREEQRWLREESRWITERESLLREISMLRLRLQQLEAELERRNSLSGSLPQIATVLQTTISLPSPPSDPLELSSSSSSSSSSSTPHPPPEVVEQKDPIAKDDKEEEDLSKRAKDIKLHWKTLRFGSEGDEVRLMQEALLELGFYSGEEDMEYSAFSSGTDLAVKTWQSSLGVPEDGIMTDELLKRLYSPQSTEESDQLGNENGAAITSVTESAEIRETIIKKEGKSELELSHRVFLLGENRWEEPSRLTGNEKRDGANVQSSPIKCIACQGEGRLLCTECDGSGEPNIEPQFMEWVDEGTKCPYCEGQGYTTCDTCQGKSTI